MRLLGDKEELYKRYTTVNKDEEAEAEYLDNLICDETKKTTATATPQETMLPQKTRQKAVPQKYIPQPQKVSLQYKADYTSK